MRLYLLRKRDDLPSGSNPWEPGNRKMLACTVVAEAEDEARKIAHENGLDENHPERLYEAAGGEPAQPWLDERYTTCKVLYQTVSGAARLLWADYQPGVSS